MKVDIGLNTKVVSDIQSVLSTVPQIDKAVLYGSRALGTYKSGSDIDLTLFGEGLSFQTLSVLEAKLDDLLLPYRFDISVFEAFAEQELKNHITTCGLVLYHKEGL